MGPRDSFVRPTGPFDPELPVLAFRDSADNLLALIFNHSTHSVRTRQPGKRSPSFYGLAAQELKEELGAKLGLDIKNRSPFRYAYIAELANDWIGYLPDLDAHKLGGYQVWTGFHSYAEPGTGERIVDEAVGMLKNLAE